MTTKSEGAGLEPRRPEETNLNSSLTEAFARVNITSIWHALGGGELRRNRGVAFWRPKADGWSVSVNDQKDSFYDFRDARGGGILDLIQTALGCDRRAAVKWLLELTGVPDRNVTPAEKRNFARRRAAAEHQAADITTWRAWALRSLRFWRNTYWDAARRAQTWMQSPAGRAASWDHQLLLVALRAVSSGQRFGDRLNETLEQILNASPAEILELRDRMTAPAESRAA